MKRAGQRARREKHAHRPAWVGSVPNQNEWIDRYKIALKVGGHSDVTIAAILDSPEVLRTSATKVRLYADKDITRLAYRNRKARGAKHTAQLRVAIAGLKAAIALYANRGCEALTQFLTAMVLELSGERERAKRAFASKRHGRDREHSILYECQMYLESQLKRDVTYSTLATLVSAGFAADGRPPEHVMTEEKIRKNLTKFKKNNPELCHLVSLRYPRECD